MTPLIRWLVSRVHWLLDAAAFWEKGLTHQVCLSMYDAEPGRSARSNIHGGFNPIRSAQTLNSGASFTMPKGIGKIMFYVNAGSDLVGEITVTGTKVDRETGTQTGSSVETITLNGLTTVTDTTDANGNTVRGSTNAYITSDWYVGTVTISTTNLTLTDIDAIHVSFEQWNDTPRYFLETLDANILVTNVAAEFDAYLYTLTVQDKNICSVTMVADVHVGAVGNTAIAGRYYRLRRGNLNIPMIGTSDGIWLELIYSNSPAYVEDVSVKVWAR